MLEILLATLFGVLLEPIPPRSWNLISKHFQQSSLILVYSIEKWTVEELRVQHFKNVLEDKETSLMVLKSSQKLTTSPYPTEQMLT